MKTIYTLNTTWMLNHLYEYAASGILYPADSNAPENIIHEYGIKEVKCEK